MPLQSAGLSKRTPTHHVAHPLPLPPLTILHLDGTIPLHFSSQRTLVFNIYYMYSTYVLDGYF